MRRRNIGYIAAAVLTGIVLFAVAAAGFAARWAFTTWSELNIDEILFQLQAPLRGTGNGMIGQYLLFGLAPALLCLLIYTVLAVRLEGRLRWLLLGIVCVLSLTAGILLKRYVWAELNVSQWLAGQSEKSAFIEENYTSPDEVEIVFPENKRNLIYIYLESMEVTFADRASGGDFEKNVIPELTKLARENEDFSGSEPELNGAFSHYGTGFTMGAIFAHTTGLPLKTGINNNMKTQNSFFPEVVSLGDILKKEGYHQVFLIGSNATFGGRRLFFETHGNYDIRDYKYAKENGLIPEDYKIFWGYEDEKLFRFARDELLQLAQGDEPFNLTLLTVDTHFEDGYVCELCGDEFGDNQYANVMACSSRQVDEFLSWVREQDFYEDTAIVICGDHPTMDKDFCGGVAPEYLRKAYTVYINAAVQPKDEGRRREYSSFDDFPTTLAALGAHIDGDRLGLGTDLFSGTDTLTEEYGREYVETELWKKSDFLEKMESFDATSQKMQKQYRKEMKGSVSFEDYDPEKRTVTCLVRDIMTSMLRLSACEILYGEGSEEKPADPKALRKVTPEWDAERGCFAAVLDLGDWDSSLIEYHLNGFLADPDDRTTNVTVTDLQTAVEDLQAAAVGSGDPQQ